MRLKLNGLTNAHVIINCLKRAIHGQEEVFVEINDITQQKEISDLMAKKFISVVILDDNDTMDIAKLASPSNEIKMPLAESNKNKPMQKPAEPAEPIIQPIIQPEVKPEVKVESKVEKKTKTSKVKGRPPKKGNKTTLSTVPETTNELNLPKPTQDQGEKQSDYSVVFNGEQAIRIKAKNSAIPPREENPDVVKESMAAMDKIEYREKNKSDDPPKFLEC